MTAPITARDQPIHGRGRRKRSEAGQTEMAKLNLQEKRRIENLVFDEINDAVRTLISKRSDQYSELKKRLAKNPPEPVKKLREEIVQLKKRLR